MKMIVCCLVLALVGQCFASNAIPDKYLGSWEVDKSENFDEYLTAKGYGWFMRQMVKMASITKVFEKSTTPNHYNCKIFTTKTNVEWLNWKLDKEFKGLYLDETNHLITFSYDSKADKLIEKHINIDKENATDVYEYTIKEGFLVMRMKYDDVVTYRYYKKTPSA